MFWKKKEKATDLFEINQTDRRESFRVNPLEDQPLFCRVQDKNLRILDIGALGLSIPNADFSENKSYPASFTLPNCGAPIYTSIYIIRIDTRRVCHCSFAKLRPEETDEIHKYMLEVQKTLSRKKKQSD